MGEDGRPDRPRFARADALLHARGFATTPAEAGALILAGRVMVTDARGRERRLDKAGERLPPEVRFRLKGERGRFVSRAGLKLDAALDRFGVEVRGREAVDLGLSTGGFTDCLLQRGAARVHGVDVSYGLVDWRIRTDPRVVLHERTNARHLTPANIGDPVDLVVLDLSFIGLDAIWPVLPPLLRPSGEVVALVKPQFELERGATEDGIVTDPEARRRAVDRAEMGARAAGLVPRGRAPSAVPGRSGNEEWFLHLGADPDRS